MHYAAATAIEGCSPDQARRIHTKLAMMLSTGLLSAVALSVPVSLGIQIIFASLSVLILGIPHGAMDHRVGEWVLKDRLQKRWIPIFAAVYCGLTLVMLLIWYLAPSAALLMFLTLSALHFGLGDTKSNQPKTTPGHHILVAFTRGTIPIGLPVIFHRNEVSTLFGWLMPQTGGVSLLPMPAIFWAAMLITIPALTFQLFRSISMRDPGTFGELVLLALVASILPPLISFAIYFGLWHAPRHLIELACWSEQQFGVRSSHSTAAEASLVNGFRRIALEAIPLTLLTWAMMAAGFLILRKSMSVDASTVRVLFVSLSALTVPHMLFTAAAEER